MTEEIRYLGDVQRLELQPGDVIVLSSSVTLSEAEMASLREIMMASFPDHKGIILQPGLKFGVIRNASRQMEQVEVVTADGKVVRRITVD